MQLQLKQLLRETPGSIVHVEDVANIPSSTISDVLEEHANISGENELSYESPHEDPPSDGICDFTGHYDKVIQLTLDEEEPSSSSQVIIDSLEVAAQRDTHPKDICNQYPLVGKIVANASRLKGACEYSDDVITDAGEMMPSGEMLSTDDFCFQTLVDMRTDAQDSFDTVDHHSEEVVSGNSDVTVDGFIPKKDKKEEVARSNVTRTTDVIRSVPPLGLNLTNDRDRTLSSEGSQPFSSTPNKLPKTQSTVAPNPSHPSSPITVRSSSPIPIISSSNSSEHRLNTPSHSILESSQQTSSPYAATIRQSSTPVYLESRAAAATCRQSSTPVYLDSRAAMPTCPVCSLSFTEEHNISYRTFHANACIDRSLSES